MVQKKEDCNRKGSMQDDRVVRDRREIIELLVLKTEKICLSL